MEITRKPLGWFKTKPQARQDFGDPAELSNFGESVKERQQSSVGALADGDAQVSGRKGGHKR
jgi:hypothetical protein